MQPEEKAQIGDTIEAIWEEGSFKARVTGVVGDIDVDGDYLTVDGRYINYVDSFPTESAPVVNILKKKPVDLSEKFRNAPVGSVATKDTSQIWHKVAGNTWAKVVGVRYGAFRWPDAAMAAEGDVVVLHWFDTANAR